MSSTVSQFDSATEPSPWPLGRPPDSLQKLDELAISNCCAWLSFHRIWGILTDDVLRAIAQSFYALDAEPGENIYHKDNLRLVSTYSSGAVSKFMASLLWEEPTCGIAVLGNCLAIPP
jgi:hypothetical protein